MPAVSENKINLTNRPIALSLFERSLEVSKKKIIQKKQKIATILKRTANRK